VYEECMSGREYKHKEEMDLDSAAGELRNDTIHLHGRRAGDASMELAAATAVRLAPNYLLAGARTVAALPDPVRGLGRFRGRKRAHASSHERTHGGKNGGAHEGTVGKDDPGGTRKIPPRPWRLLGPRGAARSEADGVSLGRAGVRTDSDPRSRARKSDHTFIS